jgi:hypothetical protein
MGGAEPIACRAYLKDNQTGKVRLKREVKGGPYAHRQKPVGCLYIGTARTTEASDQLNANAGKPAQRGSLAHRPQFWGFMRRSTGHRYRKYDQKSLREAQHTVIKNGTDTTSIPAMFQYPAPGVTLLPEGALQVV